MTLAYALAQAARHDMPEDVRKPALAHLYALLPTLDDLCIKGLDRAIFMTNDDALFALVQTLNWPKLSGELHSLIHDPTNMTPSQEAGKAWVHMTNMPQGEFLNQMRETAKAQSSPVAAVIAQAYMDRPTQYIDTRILKRVSTLRLNAEWDGQGPNGTAIDKLLIRSVPASMWIDSFGRQNHYFGLATLMRLQPREVVIEAINAHGLAGRIFTAHDFIEFLSKLPSPTIWRHMNNREAGQSLRVHLGQYYDWALSRKERKALKRSGKRGGPHMANSPEAIQKRKQRAAKRALMATLHSQEGDA